MPARMCVDSCAELSAKDSWDCHIQVKELSLFSSFWFFLCAGEDSIRFRPWIPDVTIN